MTPASMLDACLRGRRTLAFVPALALAMVACADGSGGDGDAGGSSLPSGLEVMHNTLDNTILPGFVAFETSTVDMQAQVSALCTAPTLDALEAAQTSWRSSSEAWNNVVAYDLGPLDDDVITPAIIFVESMRQRGDDYTQTVRDAARLAIDGTEPLDAAYAEALTFNKVGLLAIEVLVFEDGREGNSTAPEDVLADFMERPRKCAYLQAVVTRLVGTADTVEHGWSVSFLDGPPFRETMLGPELADGAEPIAGLIVALFEHLAYVRDRKLEGILDAQLSGHFYANVTAMLRGLQQLLEQPEPEGAVGIFDFMLAHGFDAEVQATRANLDAALAAAAAEDRAGLSAAIGGLEGNVKREIPDALGVELGLTFTDGD